MISAKFFDLANLAKVQTLYIYKITKFVIIGIYKYFVLATFLIMLLYFEGLNNGQKLTVVSFVSSFG